MFFSVIVIAFVTWVIQENFSIVHFVKLDTSGSHLKSKLLRRQS
jgi:hypothetical protein